MNAERPIEGGPSARNRPRLSALRSLLRVFVATVPLYAAGIALLEYLLVPRGVSLAVGVFSLWAAVTIFWLVTGFADSYAFRFGLRSLLSATVVVAVVCFLAVHYVQPYLKQHRAIELMNNVGVRYETRVYGPPWLQRLAGADFCQVVTAVQGHQQSRLDDSLMQCLSGSPHVYELFIGNSYITDQGLKHIDGMTDLAALDLPSNPSVSNACFAYLPAMKRLIWIDASDVPVGDDGLAYLSTLTQLEQIELNRSQITDAGLAHLGGLTNLRRLVLDKNQITNDGLKHLRPLTNLQMLSLQKTQVTDEGLANLEGFQQLRHLRLGKTKISEDGLPRIAKLKKLAVLELDGTEITLNDLRTIREQLPDCAIIDSKGSPNEMTSRPLESAQFNGFYMYKRRLANRDDPFDIFGSGP